MNKISISFGDPKIILDFNDPYMSSLQNGNRDVLKDIQNKMNSNTFISIFDVYNELGLSNCCYGNLSYYNEYGWYKGKFGHFVIETTFNKKIFGFTITRTRRIFKESD